MGSELDVSIELYNLIKQSYTLLPYFVGGLMRSVAIINSYHCSFRTLRWSPVSPPAATMRKSRILTGPARS